MLTSGAAAEYPNSVVQRVSDETVDRVVKSIQDEITRTMISPPPHPLILRALVRTILQEMIDPNG